jgi:hypothetical protein
MWVEQRREAKAAPSCSSERRSVFNGDRFRFNVFEETAESLASKKQEWRGARAKRQNDSAEGGF